MISKMNWIPVHQSNPEKMKRVLICDIKGQIRKAFKNLGNLWVIDNVDSLNVLYYKNESDVLAWMPLPEVYKECAEEKWILASKNLPAAGKKVLVCTQEEIYIAKLGNNGMWFLKNSEKSKEWSYLSMQGVVAWMPLPEVYN